MDRLTRELLAETTVGDIPEGCRAIVDIIGLERLFELAEYAQGDSIYIPKLESLTAPARNRRIKKEWNGYNMRELADKYGLTQNRIRSILSDEPLIGQISLFDLLDGKIE